MKLLKVLAIGATIGGVALATAHEKVSAAEWTPRTVQQISADIAKTNGKEYTIVWGDTLSGISQATNISVQKLADMNKIANVDLIYAGNKLIFSGNVATVQNNKGETVVQSVIQPQDKVDSTKPVGQPATSQGTTSNNTTNSATQNTTTPSTDNTVAGNTQTGGQTTENTGSTTPSTPENNGGTTQTPTQPDNNQNGSTGGNTGGGQTTPSNPGNNEGNQGGSTGGNTGGSTTDPSKPTTPEKPVQYKYTVWYYAYDGKDPQYNIEKGQHVFDTEAEATAWIDNYADNCPVSGTWGVMSWEVKQ
ncbi:LysM peptidoglycan-binding domain-containing protein [Enterococcus hirae]|uniref:LysM peptidoglycan-binding domain-containing protein n=1 Tax=Enterococcus hirae TaxID=1354 RepID=UPI0009C17A9B|nr:LysM peptidoglycan-binding domain-containing protein [Enterococcus hirae]EMF0103103.1 LysM peptidoglycan-binding domain-containing protein [Enterococcus hirae]EMF0512065.1 LysM peptidoglycan-binding domain-containing protein [Enterococcus hirae]EMF0517520.1 LysM peptidoglycan-binding domain-containing protein [Enterococcus hirae]EMF0617649.1 LysM peptidoglycan-binding domain-containing protein [Enterococcus hirae]OQO43558.1 peptidoglycan-binding protein [Enterococcus hirae]